MKVYCNKISCKHITRNSKQQQVCTLDTIILTDGKCLCFKHFKNKDGEENE